MLVPWSKKLFIIAEAGVNHNGDLAMAHRLIDAAADSGADAVKFQTFKSEALVSKSAVMADYQKNNTGVEESQYAMLKRLELPWDAHQELLDHAARRGILFFSTAFDLDSLEFLKSIPIPLWKIPSGEITNRPYLERIGALGLPTILSTGMASLAEIEDAVDVLLQSGLRRDQLCILHCNTEYPTPMEDVNLLAMQNLGRAFGCSYGYSDHTQGIEIPIAATALGASVLEKHFTLDVNLPGPDHRASLEPAELRSMVDAVRAVEQALGNGVKAPSPSERKNKSIARKSIVAGAAIRQGEIFTESNLTIKRPGTGISPMRWYEILGKAAPRDFAEDEVIQW